MYILLTVFTITFEGFFFCSLASFNLSSDYAFHFSFFFYSFTFSSIWEQLHYNNEPALGTWKLWKLLGISLLNMLSPHFWLPLCIIFEIIKY